MSHNSVLRLHHLTKLLILILLVVATEMDSKYGLYLATILWLEFAYVVKVEKKVLEYLHLKFSNKREE